MKKMIAITNLISLILILVSGIIIVRWRARG
jgi:cytochrome b subunit of formate dehydrogenase